MIPIDENVMKKKNKIAAHVGVIYLNLFFFLHHIIYGIVPVDMK